MSNEPEFLDDQTIYRCPHDKSNNFAIIALNLIRDSKIPPDVIWLIIYLLGNRDDWRINVKQVVNHLKGKKGYGRDNVEKMFNQAIEAGYIKRIIWYKGNLKRVKYIVSEEPKFKEILQQPEVQGAESQGNKERIKERKKNISLKNGILPIMPIQETARDLPTSDPIGITVFSLDEGIFPDGSKLSLQTARAFAKYNDRDRERLEANVRYYNTQISLGMRPKKSYECWLQDCINKDYASKQTNTSQNDLYAKFIKEMHNLNNQELYIMKTIVKLNSDSIDKKLPPSTFKQIIDNFIRNRR